MFITHRQAASDKVTDGVATGQEEIWRRVWWKWNLTEAELAEHFSGPAFLAWQRMGNLRGWGGQLSDHWMLAQAGDGHS